MFPSVFMDLLRSLSDMGICLCFTWLSHIWSHFIGSSKSQDMASLESLPDNVMTDVLSRLPADQVIDLRRVCKRWCSLTATHYFVQLHLERPTPVMIFQTCSHEHITHDKFTLFSVDWSSKKKKQLIREIRWQKIESVPSKGSLRFSGCCNGLFIFRRNGRSPFFFDIFDPVRQERATIASRLIVGVFFNSLTNKYQLVTFDNVMDDFRFYIGTLGPIITWREVGSFHYRPIELFAPPVVNGRLYWMAIGKRGKKDIMPPCTHSIMVFSIEDCKFRFLPHPGKLNESCHGHEMMHLLATKGDLYAYGMYAKILDIWVLEETANWYWVKKFSIHLERDLKQYSIDDLHIMSYQTYFQTKLIDIWKDKVLLVVPEKGFFRFHMWLKTLTHLHVEDRRRTCKPFEVIAIESMMSLVSLRDFFGLASSCKIKFM